MWSMFAVLSGSFYTLQGLITRHVLKGNKKDVWAFSFYFSAVGSLIAFPFFLTNFKVAHTWSYWILMMIVGLLIVAQNLLNFKSANHLPASVGGAMTKFRLVWILILGVIILKEALTWQKTFGTVLAVLAGIIILNKAKKIGSVQGLILVFASTIFYAVVIILYKYLFQVFNSQSLTFFIFLIPMLINLLIMPNSINRIVTLAKTDGKFVFLACALGGFANLAMNYALSIGEASRVLVIIESFLIITLVGEHLVLKEKKHLAIKLIAVILAIMGAVLIRIG